MAPDLYSLRATVQHNCHISDALHARNYTMCIYLLKMREYYRWERRFPFNATLPKEELGDWLSHREILWEGLESEEFEPIRVKGCKLDPFETAAINRELIPHGMVYSGGYGGHAAPHFFLADLIRATSLRREFFVPDRLPFTDTLSAEAVLPATTATLAGGGAGITRAFVETRTAATLRFVIEFLSTPGKVYTVLYTDDLSGSWKVATPSITAVATSTQWYDDGPPKTDSPPLAGSGSRLYHILQNP